MRGEGDGNLGQGVFKARALCGQGVHGRGSDAASPVAAQAVPAQRIDGDQQNRHSIERERRVSLREAGRTTEQARENCGTDRQTLWDARRRGGWYGHDKSIGRPTLGLRLILALTGRDSSLIRNLRFQLWSRKTIRPVDLLCQPQIAMILCRLRRRKG